MLSIIIHAQVGVKLHFKMDLKDLIIIVNVITADIPKVILKDQVIQAQVY
jgi:hypothetical protein